MGPACIGRVAWICRSGWDYCVDRVTGEIILGVRGIGVVGPFSGAWASYDARRGFAGWGINCVDRVTGIGAFLGGVGSAQLVHFGGVGIVCVAWICQMDWD